MADLQGVSALFRSPDAAVMANQAVMASELAARQGSASLQIDAQLREYQVTQALQAADTAQIGGRDQAPEDGSEPRGRRRGTPSGGTAGPMAPAPVHRIDLIA